MIGYKPTALGGTHTPNSYFQITSGGDLYSPNFNVVGGNVSLTGDIYNGAISITKEGDISTTSGQFSVTGGDAYFGGTLAANIVETENIVGAAITTTISASTTANTITTSSITIPDDYRGVLVTAFFSAFLTTVLNTDGKTTTSYSSRGPSLGEIFRSGSSTALASGYGSTAYSFVPEEIDGGSYTFTATRPSGSYGVMTIVVQLAKK